MAVTFPRSFVQRMDEDAQKWMLEAKDLLDKRQYPKLQQKVESSVCYFGSFEKPSFLYSGATFSSIRALVRELFSENRYADASILMHAFVKINVLTPGIGLYALAIQAIRRADLSKILEECLPDVQMLLQEEIDYFLGEGRRDVVRQLGFLKEQVGSIAGALEVQSIMKQWD